MAEDEAQQVEQVEQSINCRAGGLRLPLTICRKVLEQDTETHFALDVCVGGENITSFLFFRGGVCVRVIK